MSTALTAIQGTLPEKVQAFEQISRAAAAGVFGGWDSNVKVFAACWMADALGVHPGVVLTRVHAFVVRGKLTTQVPWELENALLQARVPGFRFTIQQRDEKAAEATFYSDVFKEGVRVRYSWEDAKRQGLAGKDTYQQNPSDMLWKQMFHRGADMVGASALMGLPVYSDADFTVLPSGPAPSGVAMTSGAEVVEEEEKVPAASAPASADRRVVTSPAAGTEPDGGAAGPRPAAPAAAAPASPPVQRQPEYSDLLVDKVRELWPNTNGRSQVARDELMRVLALVAKQATGTIVEWKAIKEIDESVAMPAYQYLVRRYPPGTKTPAAPMAEDVPEAEDDDAPPPVGDLAAPAAPAAEAPAQQMSWRLFAEMLDHVARELKCDVIVHGKNAKTGELTSTLWIVDAEILGAVGRDGKSPLKVHDGTSCVLGLSDMEDYWMGVQGYMESIGKPFSGRWRWRRGIGLGTTQEEVRDRVDRNLERALREDLGR